MIQLKNPEQLEGIRRASRVLTETFLHVGELIEPGITTRELDARVEEFIRQRGGVPAFLDYGGFPASICASVNDTVIHGIPDDRPLKEGDILSCDIGIILDGYFSDSSETFPVGGVKDDIAMLLRVTRESLHAGIEAARAGGRVKDIGKAVSEVVRPHGYGIVSFSR